jgi:hypothetical protein
MNFTREFEKVELKLLNIVQKDTPEYVDPDSNLARIIFTNDVDRISFKVSPPINEKLIKGLVATGKAVGTVASSVG